MLNPVQDNNFEDFSQCLLAWFDQHGRTDLPWQYHPSPYHIWISETMLQQTQVHTVIPYYQRFIQRFPEIALLAEASLDEVLHYWTGLGYYARARHLYCTAQKIYHDYQSEFPTEFDELIKLPGIGRSTAGAILALAYGQRFPILDGNVKRVLCRYHAIEGWPGQRVIERKLWDLATHHTPIQRVSAYTQAIMDIGAIICTPRRPHCSQCPLQHRCLAHCTDRVALYPTPKPRKTLPIKSVFFLMIQNSSYEVLLQKRPPKGLWGGLWSFPECATIELVSTWCQEYLNLTSPTYDLWSPVRHTFTHFHLDIMPIYLRIHSSHPTTFYEEVVWYNITQPPSYGLAAPVVRLLAQLPLPHSGD